MADLICGIVEGVLLLAALAVVGFAVMFIAALINERLNR